MNAISQTAQEGAQATSRQPPVFVGGSGSSGTTITARLIGEHPQFAFIPTEVNFHAEPQGLPGLLAGRVELGEFLTHLRQARFRYEHHSGLPRGLYNLIGEADFEAALSAFERDFAATPVTASNQLVRAILDPVAALSGKPSWVEMTPRNAVGGRTLTKIFPGARIVHSIRDGRDVAADKVRRGMKVADVFAALDWWGRKITRADALATALGDQMLVIRMEDLVRDDREAAYQRLLAFLEVEDAPSMRSYFEERVRPDTARIGSWRSLVDPDHAEAFDRRYHELVDELRAKGVTSVDLVAPGEASEAPPQTPPAARPPAAAPASGHAPANEWIRVNPKRIASAADQGSADRSGALWKSMEAEGFKTQGQLPGGDLDDEVEAEIDAEGRVRVRSGLRRVAVAALLGISEIPVKVRSRDPAWLEFRDSVLTYAEGRRKRVYQLVDHPDLIDIPAYHRSGRVAILTEALADYEPEGKRLLDIGSHWGYMPQQMERLGFRCVGVEHNSTCVTIARQICTATEGNYEIWAGSIFDYPDAEQQDVVLALNVFNHFIKTEELHSLLERFLQRLSADVIFFEPHRSDQPGKMPPGVYRNYAPLEFAEWVAQNAGMSDITFLGEEPDHHSQWKRSIYKIER